VLEQQWQEAPMRKTPLDWFFDHVFIWLCIAVLLFPFVWKLLPLIGWY